VEAAVKIADEAVKTRTAIETETTFFRETGNRKKLFDKVNAVRKQTYGELAKMPHEKVGLPAGFANLFFRHESSRDDGPMTLERADEELARLEKETAEMKALRAPLQAQLEQEAKVEAEKAAEQAAIVALEKAAAEAAQKVAEAKAKLAALPA
jgi:hypothetical protein